MYKRKLKTKEEFNKMREPLKDTYVKKFHLIILMISAFQNFNTSSFNIFI